MRFAVNAGIACLSVALFAAAGPARAQVTYDPEAVAAARDAFVERMVERHGFDREELAATLAQASISEPILDAISHPAERVVPWYEYRGIFLTPERIEAGARFWRAHAEAIDAAAARFGVDADIIVAIVGIETYFGERMGSHKVLDALSTLAFAYPPRSQFFTSELESFFLLAREEGPGFVDAVGSYAGAMGAGQFIPSSYRAYAVDADNDGHRDLWNSWDDTLASVANYLSEHGWEAGELIAEPATQREDFSHAEPTNGLELDETAGSLAAMGYEFSARMGASAPAAVFSLEHDATSAEYWIGYRNFRVITRYNRSPKYALAAVELGEAIRNEYESKEVASR